MSTTPSEPITATVETAAAPEHGTDFVANPDRLGLSMAVRAFTAVGFAVASEGGGRFAVTGEPAAFERFFGVRVRAGEVERRDGSRTRVLAGDDLPSDVRGLVRAVRFEAGTDARLDGDAA